MRQLRCCHQEDGRVNGGDELVSMFADVILEGFIGAITKLLHVRCVGQPSKAMDVGATSVLPLKPQPVVCGSKDSNIQSPEELHNSVVEEPVSKSWVLDDGLGSGSPRVSSGIARGGQKGQLPPLFSRRTC